jgi:hypothetical protein
MFKQLTSAAVALSLLQLACSSDGSSGAAGNASGSGGSGPSVAVPGSGGRGASGGSSAMSSGGSSATGGAAGAGGGAGDAAESDAAASLPDAADLAPGGQISAKEIQILTSSTSMVRFTTMLVAGEIYLLRAAGSMKIGDQQIDAEYSFGAGAPADEVGGMDVGLDVDRLQIHPKVHTTATPPGPGRMKWGAADRAFRDDHVYFMLITGDASPLTVKLVAPAGAPFTGSAIVLTLHELSPAPPKQIGAELETIMVPLIKTQVTTKLTTVAGKQYILQASGTGKVSKGGIGDAEYMDFDIEGTKFNEGESGADFGIGVDELDVGIKPTGGASYKPRLRWWGPWRKDHTYYMIFTGTGKPIDLLYFDSGYGDNGLTDALPLKIFAAP